MASQVGRSRKIDTGWMRILVEIGRRGSLSAAAGSLGLTQPAISYQVRRLEEQFGFPLLKRTHGGVEFTSRGRSLFEIALRSVEEIDRFARENTPSQRPTVRLRTDYAFSSLWLIPRMHAFRQRHSDIDIQIVATQSFEPAEMEDTDIAVVFGEQSAYEDAGASMLLPERVVPVCTATFRERSGLGDGAVDRLLTSRLVHLDAPQIAPWFDWASYFRALGRERLEPDRQGDLRFNTYSLVVQAALEHQGVALGWIGLIDSMVRSGILSPAGPPIEAPGRGYILLPPAKMEDNSRDLIAWLKSEANATNREA